MDDFWVDTLQPLLKQYKLRGFLTGSRVFGYSTPASDYDVVAWLEDRNPDKYGKTAQWRMDIPMEERHIPDVVRGVRRMEQLAADGWAYRNFSDGYADGYSVLLERKFDNTNVDLMFNISLSAYQQSWLRHSRFIFELGLSAEKRAEYERVREIMGGSSAFHKMVKDWELDREPNPFHKHTLLQELP